MLISPRRFGKSSLVAKAVKMSGRPSISLNLQNMLSIEDFASKILRELFRLYPLERIKHLMKAGYIIRVTDYEIEDPFFKAWIVKSCL